MSEIALATLTVPAYSEAIQAHSILSFKLVSTVAEFTQQLSEIRDRHSEDLQVLVEAFRKRNAELRKERTPYQSTLFSLWEMLLQEVEAESHSHGEISRFLSRNMGNGLLEKTFHKKIQSRKAFLHRESVEAILNKANEALETCYRDYSVAHKKFVSTQSPAHLQEYYEAHNNYVQQLHATNGMIKLYQIEIVPRLLEEIQESYLETSSTIAASIHSSIEMLATKTREQTSQYQSILMASKGVNGRSDLSNFVKSLTLDKSLASGSPSLRMHTFTPPGISDDMGSSSIDSRGIGSQGTMLQNEVIIDRNIIAPKIENVRQEIRGLEVKISKLEESLESLAKLQQRSRESNLFNKSNEIQEDMSQKRFELYVSSLHRAAVKSQLDLYHMKERDLMAENGPSNQRDRKSSSSSSSGGSGIKNRWIKAFKSLTSTPTPPFTSSSRHDSFDKSDGEDKASSSGSSDRFSQMYGGQHVYQEYTYKKITPCDVCREILRGHSRQGLRCKMCKINVHFGDCQDHAPKCQAKPRLLRRQKSASELDSGRIPLADDDDRQTPVFNQSIDPVYDLLRKAVDAGRRTGGPGHDKPFSSSADRNWSQVIGQMGILPPASSSHHVPRNRSSASSSGSSSCASAHLLSVLNSQQPASSSAPHSPQRKKLTLRMKSFSLDESTQQVYGSRQPQASAMDPSQHLTQQQQQHQQQSQGIMSQNRSHNFNNLSINTQMASSGAGGQEIGRRIPMKGLRMSSVEIPDTNDKSSASPSPCPSPKPQRLLPTNLYVVLYEFRARHDDEMDLKPGAILTVTDTSDLEWWQGKCYGQMGFFPSKYVAKLNASERPLVMTHTIQVSDGESMVKLLRDQIVIQVSEEVDGIAQIRVGGTNDRIVPVPVKYVQEV